MKLLKLQHGVRAKHSLVLLFGYGLIGQVICRQLQKSELTETYTLPYSWTDARQRAKDITALKDALDTYGISGAERICVVWAGGRGGFGSGSDEMEAEYGLLSQVVSLGQTLREKTPNAVHGIHLMSSAGGLFEGQSHCHKDSLPAPLRPYGVGKMQQEALIGELDTEMVRCIYRPSSVYGVSSSGRSGLITALIGNALRHRTSPIFGNGNTLRDYVLADDIGRFVAHEIVYAQPGATQIHLMANGRSASVYEVINLVEQTLQTRLHLQFDPNPSNALNMGFLPSALPARWRPSDLSSGISMVAMKLKQNWVNT